MCGFSAAWGVGTPSPFVVQGSTCTFRNTLSPVNPFCWTSDILKTTDTPVYVAHPQILLQLEFGSSVFSVLPFLIRSRSKCASFSSSFSLIDSVLHTHFFFSFLSLALSFLGSFSLTYLYIFLRFFILWSAIT